MGNNITQKLKYKESVVKFSYRFGVTKAAIRYKQHRKTIYRWLEKYDGTAKSLVNKSRKPHYHPNEHSAEEITKIKKYRAQNKNEGLVVLWVKLMQNGYTRSISGLFKVMQRIGIYKKTPSKKKEYTPKPYEQMTFPGERVQVDVKFVPTKCLSVELQKLGERYFQYTGIDEYTRIRYTWFTNEHSTYESSKFVRQMVRYFREQYDIEIKTIQTDNGFEFTNRLSWNAFLKNKKTMFESTLEELGIEYKVIKPHTPKENGRVERSHRKDQERFYYNKVFYSLEDLKNRGKDWRKEYNNFPMRPLGWLSPKEFLKKYRSQEELVMTI